MGEVATASHIVTPNVVGANVNIQKLVGKLVIEFYENSVEMKFEGDVKGRQLDIAIRQLPRRYKMWRNIQLTELKKKEK